MKALIHANLYDFASYRPDSYVLYDTEIRETGRMKDFPGAEETQDCRGMLVLPGLALGHAHIYSTLVRGISLSYNPQSFKQILEQLWWKFDREIDIEATYHSARVAGTEHLKCGITTLIDHHASGRAIRGTLNTLKKGLCDETGLRGVFCFETSDRFDIYDCIAENVEFARSVHGGQCAGMFGMHASLSLSEETLSRIAKAIGEMPIHIHAAESREDEADSLEKYGKRVVERLDGHGLLHKGSLLAHCTHIDEREAAIIAERGCTVALNPTSNMNNAVGLPDHPLLKSHGIQTIIGNDSLGCNITREYLNLLYGMHLKTGSAWKFSYEDLRHCITAGYDYAGGLLGIRLGKFEPGYVADMAAIPYDAPTPLDAGNIFGHVVNGVFDHYHPRDVWCGGKQLLHNYQTVYDESKIYAEAREAAGRLWERVAG